MARIGCGSNAERLCTEPSSNHKAILIDYAAERIKLKSWFTFHKVLQLWIAVQIVADAGKPTAIKNSSA